MSTTIEGVKVSDQLGALLDHTAAQDGWRIEASPTKSRAGGASLVVYPADKDRPPITVTERSAKFNKPHYENIRRDLYRAGLPPLPADRGNVIFAEDIDEARALAPEGHRVMQIPTPDTTLRNTATGEERPIPPQMADPDEQPAFVASVVESLLSVGGHGVAERDLAGSVVKTVIEWLIATDSNRMKAAIDALEAEVREAMKGEIDEALTMAAEHEATAARATAALERAQAAERKARDDCGTALERAKAAEAKVRELEGVLAPLRTFMAGGK